MTKTKAEQAMRDSSYVRISRESDLAQNLGAIGLITEIRPNGAYVIWRKYSRPTNKDRFYLFADLVLITG